MKKAIILILLFSLMQGCATYDVNANKAKNFPPFQEMKIAVLPFIPPNTETTKYSTAGGSGTFVTPENAGASVADAVNAALINIPNIVLIERSQLERILEEHKLSLSGVIKNPDFKLLGKLLPVDALIVGNVTSFQRWHDIGGFGGIVAFNARLVNLHSGEILFTISGNAAKRGEFVDQIAHNLARDAIKKLLEK